MRSAVPRNMAEIPPQAELPALGQIAICLYDAGIEKSPVIEELKSFIRAAYSEAATAQGQPSRPSAIAAR